MVIVVVIAIIYFISNEQFILHIFNSLCVKCSLIEQWRDGFSL